VPAAERPSGPAGPVSADLVSVNAVFSLSLILAQASSPRQVMRLVTTAVPSIAPGHTGQAWHPHRAGDYYQRAPAEAAGLLAARTEPGPLELAGFSSSWAFPLMSPLAREPVFLVILGGEPLSAEEGFLLSVLAQTCGTTIAKLELIADRAAELAASEARQHAILQAALDAVVSIDGRGRVTYVNPAFEQIFGYQAGQVTGRELADVIVPPSLREAHRLGLARYLATGQRRILDQRLELTAMRADGSVFPAEVTVTRTGPAENPAFTGYVRDITERRDAERELMASRARQVAASVATRQRVARDLHDGAQQRLVTTLINLQLAEQKWESAPQRARELVGLALADARHGLDDLRELAAGILPAVLTQRGLAAAIGALAVRAPVPVEIEVSAGRLPAPVETSVYFFCSEALANVAKHARASQAWVRVRFGPVWPDGGWCEVEVRDDGAGGASPRPGSSGLTGLRDRVAALGGSMDIVSPAAGGTVLRASIPLPAEPA